jgi:hypothetical protein
MDAGQVGIQQMFASIDSMPNKGCKATKYSSKIADRKWIRKADDSSIVLGFLMAISGYRNFNCFNGYAIDPPPPQSAKSF